MLPPRWKRVYKNAMSQTSDEANFQSCLALGLVRLSHSTTERSSPCTALYQWLPEGDVRQAERNHAGHRRIEFLTGRFILRRIMQCRFGLTEVCIKTLSCGQPHLPDHPMSISISHSSGWVVAGALSHGRLGLDVEGPRKRFCLPRRLKERYCAAGVSQEFVARHWPLIEAQAKCTGTSLGLLLQRPELCLSIDNKARRGWFISDQYLMRYIKLPGAQLALCLDSMVDKVHLDRVVLPSSTH